MLVSYRYIVHSLLVSQHRSLRQGPQGRENAPQDPIDNFILCHSCVSLSENVFPFCAQGMRLTVGLSGSRLLDKGQIDSVEANKTGHRAVGRSPCATLEVDPAHIFSPGVAVELAGGRVNRYLAVGRMEVDPAHIIFLDFTSSTSPTARQMSRQAKAACEPETGQPHKR
jgi:hypothetical protein